MEAGDGLLKPKHSASMPSADVLQDSPAQTLEEALKRKREKIAMTKDKIPAETDQAV